MKTRVSLVHYLNAAPLGWAFLHGPFRGMFEIIPSSPAMCAEQLSSGEVDIGLIPSIEYQRIADLRIVPDMSISSSAEVRSILLVRPRGSKKIGSVAVDTSSRTSVALMKVLLWRKMKLDPEFFPHPPNVEEMLSRCDAALLIGDAALKVRLDEYDTLDLAAAWVEWQRRPCVFAFWAVRRNCTVPSDLSAVFKEAKDWGLRARKDIATAYAGLLKLPAAFLENYLHENIDYDLGPEHMQGLNRFYRMSGQEGLIPTVRELQFLSVSNSAMAG